MILDVRKVTVIFVVCIWDINSHIKNGIKILIFKNKCNVNVCP